MNLKYIIYICISLCANIFMEAVSLSIYQIPQLLSECDTR